MKQGFFDLGSKVKKLEEIEKQNNKRIGCQYCQLKENCDMKEKDYFGEGEKEILFIYENPSFDNNKKVFERILIDLGFNLDQDFWYTYAVRGFTEKITQSNINNCRFKLLEVIKKLNPKVIICLGDVSLKSLLKDRLTGRIKGIEYKQYFGEQIPDQEFQKWICPTYSINEITDSKVDKINLFKNHIFEAVNLRNQEIEIIGIAPKITVDLKQSLNWLDEIKENKILVFDYETTGLKPQRKEQEIISISFSNNKNCWAFPFFKDEIFKKQVKEILENPEIKKIAHNLNFENNWSKVKLGINIKNWYWDTCLAAAFINNQKSNGLKFLTYVNFGVLGYDWGIDKYINSGEDEGKFGANRLNDLKKADIEELLKYNALDSYFSYKLYKIQRKQIKNIGAYRFFQEGLEILSEIQLNGFKIDQEKMDKNVKILSKKINKIKQLLEDSEEIKKYGLINFDSNKQLSDLLYKKLSYKKPKIGNLTDEKQLNKIGSKFCKLIIQSRKYKKIRDTYLGQFEKEVVDGFIHPFFNLNIAKSYRSSSFSPNFQNQPKRDVKAKNMTRSLIIPRKGNMLIEYDYKGIEVCISSCYTKDPAMIDYILNPKNDMHRDTAADIFLKDKNKISKQERYIGKNGFVFPAFYGSSAENISKNIWEMMEDDTKQNLYDQGINKYFDFLEHMENVYNIFWNERFKVYKQWKFDIWEKYLKDGFLESKLGFRYQAPMSWTEVTNIMIQGTAFHCLLWSLIQIQKEFKKRFEKSFIIGQVHDSIVVDVYPEDEEEIDMLVNLWATEKIKEQFDWINVPLKLEKEVSKIDGSWADMQESDFKEMLVC